MIMSASSPVKLPHDSGLHSTTSSSSTTTTAGTVGVSSGEPTNAEVTSSSSPKGDKQGTTKNYSRTPTSWDAEDDILLMHLKDNQKLGWKEIASHFNNRTPNACQFRWRRLKSGNLKNPPKSAAALGTQINTKAMMAAAAQKKAKKAATTAVSSTPTPATTGIPSSAALGRRPSQIKQETTPSGFAPAFSPITHGTFQGFDNNISNALAGLNALSNSPSYISSPMINTNPSTPRGITSPSLNGSISGLSHKYEGKTETTNTLDPQSQSAATAAAQSNNLPPNGPSDSGGYYTEISVDPTMNLPHNQNHPHTPSSLTPRNSISQTGSTTIPSSGIGIAPLAPSASMAFRNNSIIQTTRDDRTSISSITRASVSSLPSKSMNIPHHQTTNNALAHLPVLFGSTGSISGPSRNPSLSGATGIQQTTVSSLRNSSVVSTNSGYYSRSGSVVIPHSTDKKDGGDSEQQSQQQQQQQQQQPLRIDREKLDASNKKRGKMRRSQPPIKSGTPNPPPLDIPWSMEEDELLINRRNRELSFAELSILLPQRTEGEIWSRIDYLEKLRNGHRSGQSRDPRRKSSLGLGDVDFYDDDDDDDDVIGGIGVSDDDDDDDEDSGVLLDVDDSISGARKRKRRASSAINPLSMRGSIRKRL
ncbi:uncharacterized protein J8A68_001591 [[Candida] subhashii]|uniref:Uncharacterized protein n=1 Tax=[Candida] subhashii TaxID=561895 RepID=A0A8J5QR41_9ASCO|nr:uncharacterized protein J8A68_001591 [[Candida] subhashii]KAG7664898.1 hypothetical protein J8A68_001591 [[Candida] subhashii]